MFRGLFYQIQEMVIGGNLLEAGVMTNSMGGESFGG